MPDPDLVFRAQLAAGALEEAWRRWRNAHGLPADPMPAVSSYVGYSIEEPWGQPRVVFGLAAQDAEQLTALLERHECVGPVFAAVTTSPTGREPQARAAAWSMPLPVPRQAQATEEERPTALANGAYDEPVYRQAAAAIQGAALQGGDAADPVDAGEAASAQDAAGDDATPMGALARAASAARAAAEARIKASRVDHGSEADASDPSVVDDAHDAPSASPEAVQVHSTDVLEPLPAPEPAVGSNRQTDEESERAPGRDDDADSSGDGSQDSSTNGAARRSRGSRGYSMPKISRTKRPGAVPGV